MKRDLEAASHAGARQRFAQKLEARLIGLGAAGALKRLYRENGRESGSHYLGFRI